MPDTAQALLVTVVAVLPGLLYVLAFPEDGDVYLAQAIAVDPDSGAIQLAADGQPLEAQGSILVRWSEVDYLQLVEEVGP